MPSNSKKKTVKTAPKKAPVTVKTVKLPTIAERIAELSQGERAMIIALGTSEYHDASEPGGATWTAEICDGKPARFALLGEIVAKGLAWLQGKGQLLEAVCALTEDGVYVFEELQKQRTAPVIQSSSPVAVKSSIAAKVDAVAAAPVVPANGKPQPTRIVAWKWRHPGGSWGVLRIVNGTETYYFAEYGLHNSYHLTKIEPNRKTTYLVVLDGSDDRTKSTCSCPAGEKGKPCKHVDGLLSLRAMGKL